MGLALVLAPTSEPVTLAEARDQCRITGSDSDALLARFLLDARQYAEGYTRRVFMTQTWDAFFRHWPVVWNGVRWESHIALPLNPVSAVSSVSYVDTGGATQVLAANQYIARFGADRLAFIEPSHGITWPDTREQSDAVTVRFVAGYGTQPGDVPWPIRQAILLHVELLYDLDANSHARLEAARDARLDPYRVVRL